MTSGVMNEQRIKNFWAKVRKTENKAECWLWEAAKNDKGYGVFQVGWKVQKRAHRIAYELTYGNIEEGLIICHTCDNPSCVNPHHLFLGTVKDNVDDMIAKGRKVNCYGQKNGAAKLSDQDVVAIYFDDRTNVEIAKIYGISPSFVSQVRRKKIRKKATAHLPEQLKRKPGSGSPAYRRKIDRLPDATLQAITAS